MDIRGVSDLVGLPVATLYQQRHRRIGVGGLAIKVGRHLRWRPEDLEGWLDEKSEQARNERLG